MLRRYLPAVLWMIVIYILSSRSSLPGPAAASANFIFHKLMHLFMYAILYFLFYRAANPQAKVKNWILPLIFTVAYAVSDELHQSLVPGRMPALHDIGYDTLGAVVMLLKIENYI